MNTEPVGISRLLDDDVTTVPIELWACLFFAVAILVATVGVIGADERSRWHPGVDLGLRVGDELERMTTTPDGLAARAGLPERSRIRIIDGVVLRERPRVVSAPLNERLVLTRRGALHAVEGTRAVEVWRWPTLPEQTRAEACDDAHVAVSTPPVDGRDACTGEQLRFTIVTGAIHAVRDGVRPWWSLRWLPFVVVFAVAVGVVGAAVCRRRRFDDRGRRRLQRGALVWSAIAAAVVVPAWLHMALLTWFDGTPYLRPMYDVVLLTTVPGWIVLIVMAARAAARHADGDFATTTTWWPLGLALAPTVMFVMLPGLAVVATSVVLLAGLERLDRWIIRPEPAPTRVQGTVVSS